MDVFNDRAAEIKQSFAEINNNALEYFNELDLNMINIPNAEDRKNEKEKNDALKIKYIQEYNKTAKDLAMLDASLVELNTVYYRIRNEILRQAITQNSINGMHQISLQAVTLKQNVDFFRQNVESIFLK